MANVRINNLADLKKWNENPTKELPIVYEWFLDWFFDEVLMNDKKELAKDAHETHIRFIMICNNFSREQAVERADVNVGYYSGYSRDWVKKLHKYFPEIKHPN